MAETDNKKKKATILLVSSIGLILVLIVSLVIILSASNPNKKYEKAFTNELQKDNCTLSSDSIKYLNQLAKKLKIKKSDKEFIEAKITSSICQPENTKQSSQLNATSKTQNNTEANSASSNNTNNQNRNLAEQHINLGLMFVLQKKYDKAQNEFLAAVHADPNYYLGYVNLASDYIAQGFLDKAMQTAQDGLKAVGDNGYIYYTLACVYSLKNDIGNSLENLNKALQFGFSDFKALKNDPNLNNVRNTNKSDFCDILQKNRVSIPYCAN